MQSSLATRRCKLSHHTPVVSKEHADELVAEEPGEELADREDQRGRSPALQEVAEYGHGIAEPLFLGETVKLAPELRELLRHEAQQHRHQSIVQRCEPGVLPRVHIARLRPFQLNPKQQLVGRPAGHSAEQESVPTSILS